MSNGLLDAASGQPLNPGAAEAWLAMADAGWADPRRLYREGRRAALLRDAARESLAAQLGVRPTELVVTTSGTEALRLSLATAAGRRVGQAVPLSRLAGQGAILASAVEHSVILEAAEDDQQAARSDGGVATPGRPRIIPVDPQGRVDVDAFAAALPGAALACLQVANQDVGTAQPLAAIAEACARAGVPLLMDATMSLGQITTPALPTPTAGHLIAGSAVSWGGPAGVGLLALRGPTGHPGGRLPGLTTGSDTLASLPLLIAAARGLEWATERLKAWSTRARDITDRLWAQIPATIPDTIMLGDPHDRLPHLVAFSCLYVDGEALVLGLDRAGYAVSSGSACVADTRRPSHVLAAMGAITHGNVRVSLPYDVADSTIDGFLAALPRIVEDARTFLDRQIP